MQTSFFQKLMNILNRRQSHEKDIDKKIDNFFQVKT